MKVTKQWFIFLGLLSSINFNSYFVLLTFEPRNLLVILFQQPRSEFFSSTTSYSNYDFYVGFAKA